ncbi:hypothetical protein ACFQ60_06175 [Streptomyces zhihengii]
MRAGAAAGQCADEDAGQPQGRRHGHRRGGGTAVGGADAVLFTPARRREWTLSYPGRLAGTADIALAESPAASGTLQGTEVAPGEIGRRLSRARVVVVLADPEGQPLDTTPAERVKRRVLARDFTVCARTDLKGGRVTLYARTVCPPPAAD